MSKDFRHVYQFKITLKNIKPDIWRKIEVPENYTFWDLHVAIQDAMGWTDSHLHLFEIKEPRTGKKLDFGLPVEEDFWGELEILPGWEEKIVNFFNMENRRAIYEYDFGDSWIHRILLQKIKPREKDVQYPRCIGGKRACPPEDCGGTGGYYELLDILSDPEHPEHDSMVMWAGKEYDPEFFDPEEVVFDDPDKRFENLWDNSERNYEVITSEKLPGADKVLNCVSGLLYFYGLVETESLFSMVQNYLEEELDFDKYKQILTQEMEEEGDYPFIYQDDFCFYLEVMFPELLYNEQRKRTNIPYRPLSQEEVFKGSRAPEVGNTEVWGECEKRLRGILRKEFGAGEEESWWDIDWIKEKFRQDLSPDFILNEFVSNKVLVSPDVMQTFLDSFMDVLNNTPLWALKGWTPNEAWKKFDVDPEFKEGMKKTFPEKKEKIGRNEPCPCGSGKKYKKCCGDPTREN